jgi:hypothetical protein
MEKSKLISISYSVCDTMVSTHNLMVEKCNLLILAFNELNKDETERLREETKRMLASREFNYSVKDLDGVWKGWSILYREAKEPIEGRDDNIGWSRPFRVVNNVMVQHRESYNSKSYHVPSLPENGSIIAGDFNFNSLAGW